MSNSEDVSPKKTLARWLAAKPYKPIQVTILFTDIVGSVKLSNQLGDEKWVPRLLQHFEQGEKLLAQHDGFKIKFIGDSFMVAFRSPVNALKFAAAFHEDTGHNSIEIRVCLHTGSGRVIEDDIFGRMINYASRILSWKREAGVVVSAFAYDQIIAEYGEQRAKELFIQLKDDLKDFPRQSIYVLNMDEWWKKRIREALPNLHEVQNSQCENECLLRAATAEEIEWIAELEDRTYGASAVPAKVLRSWYDANSNGFWVICREDGEMIGHVDVLPLKQIGVDLLVGGRESEQAITPEMIYSANESDQMESFYIESVIVKDKYKELKPRCLVDMLRSVESLMARLSPSQRNKVLYGLGATKGGERLMQQLGFRLVARADQRDDHFPLYLANYDDVRSNIAAILNGRQPLSSSK